MSLLPQIYFLLDLFSKFVSLSWLSLSCLFPDRIFAAPHKMPLSGSLLSRRFSISSRDHQGHTPTEPESPMLPPSTNVTGSSWSAMLPELLSEIIRRVEDTEDHWPLRRDVVACACVSKKWREITQETVRSPRNSGKITFPSCLKLVCLINFVCLSEFALIN